MSILSEYYRSPGIHVTLPSGGHFCKPGDLTVAMNGELGVLPMTTADEIITKNPDSLLNGYSVEQVIASCVPGVRNPKDLPNQDVDYLLLAIKKVTYGDKLELTSVCPKCKKEHEFVLSIGHRLEMYKPMESEYMVRVSDELVVYLRPYSYEAATKLNLAAFEETKMFQNLMDPEVTDEERSRMFSRSYQKIAMINLGLLAGCVVRIVTPKGTEENPLEITKFIRNCHKDIVDKIQEKMQEIAQTGLEKKVELVCDDPECGHEWQTELVIDPAHFFE